MNVTLITGKGGVGKTTTNVSLGLYSAVRQNKKTGIIDYDGGHSVKNVLGVDTDISPNQVHQIRENLSVIVIEHKPFRDIGSAKQQGWSMQVYLEQFPDDLGIVPFADMLQEFFGVPTDVHGAEKFALLVQAICLFEQQEFEEVYIDVEPTAGLERLLLKADAMERSLRNLQKTGWFTLKALGTKWPDVAAYIQGDYIKYAHRYTSNIARAVRYIRNALFLIVCTPESGPVRQTFEVRTIIETFGGAVRGCIVNNIRGESHEDKNIALLENHALPIVRIKRASSIHGEKKIHAALLYIGEEINHLFETV